MRIIDQPTYVKKSVSNLKACLRNGSITVNDRESLEAFDRLIAVKPNEMIDLMEQVANRNWELNQKNAEQVVFETILPACLLLTENKKAFSVCIKTRSENFFIYKINGIYMELSRDFTPNCDLEIDTDLQTMLSYLRHKLYLSAKYIEQGAGEDSIFGAPTGFMELTRDEMDMVVGGITTSEPCYLDVCTGYTPGTGDDMGCKANACGEQNSGACTIDACGVDGCSQNACAGDAAGGDACGADACYADACGGDACGANACAGDVCGGDACGANACGADACSIDLCGANACAAQGCWVDFIPGVPGI